MARPAQSILRETYGEKLAGEVVADLGSQDNAALGEGGPGRDEQPSEAGTLRDRKAMLWVAGRYHLLPPAVAGFLFSYRPPAVLFTLTLTCVGGCSTMQPE